MELVASQIDARWKQAFPDVARPRLYISIEDGEDGFLPINSLDAFSKDIASMTTRQLHAISSNNQIALREAQDEYFELESVIRDLTNKDPTTHPQALQSSHEFEYRHESVLYGYKCGGRKPFRFVKNWEDGELQIEGHQEPFSQGGFFPTAKQYATKLEKAKDKLNPDGWAPVMKDGRVLFPKLQGMHPEYAKGLKWTDEGRAAARASSVDIGYSIANSTLAKSVGERLTRTRYNGSKVPITRDVAEASSSAASPRASRAQTPKSLGKRQATPQTVGVDDSPVPRKRQRIDNISLDTAHPAGYTPEPDQPRPRVRVGQACLPTEPLSPRSMRNWKWTNESLLEAIQKDYLWLHPDPAKALINRDRLLAAANPVRTWSMCNKWIEWHEKGLDKRPRNKDGPVKASDQGADPNLGVGMGGQESSEQQTIILQPVSKESVLPNDEGQLYCDNDAPLSEKNSNAGSRQSSNAGSGKGSAAGVDLGTQDLLEGKARGSRRRRSGIIINRRNSTASVDFAQDTLGLTPPTAPNSRPTSVGSSTAHLSSRSDQGAKRKYTGDKEGEEEEETLQVQAEHQPSCETVNKVNKNRAIESRGSEDEVVPGVQARRSLRAKSQLAGK